ncbi:MAG: spore coat associated protein CotJA [Eubacteriaceae bacterium]|nr:spore coat associated protein CotJA [Eubacteriaceae bacterium]
MNRIGFIPLVPFMPDDAKYANAYTPYQLDVDEYCLEEALKKGTLYMALDSEYKIRLDGGDKVCC